MVAGACGRCPCLCLHDLKGLPMSSAPSVGVVAAAPVFITINGEKRFFKPLNVTLIGKWCQRMAQENVANLPTMAELMASLKGHEPAAISEAIKTMSQLHKQAMNPSIDELLAWMTDNPLNIVSVMADCIEGEPIDKDILFPVIVRELADGGKFAQQWLESSGLVGNPTKPSVA